MMSSETEVKNSVLMRDLNLSNIFQLIYNLGPISRKELAEKSDYSSATISNHVKTLLNKGFVIETEKGFSTGGRKPVYLTVNPDKGYIISVDIEVNQTKIVMFNLKLEVVRKITIPIIDKGSPEKVCTEICQEIDNMITNQNLDPEKLIGIGVAVPGLIDSQQGILKFAPNLEWEDVNIVEKFKARYNVPIILENEANAAAIGEKEFGYPGEENLVYVSVHEGIGCGVIFDGELYGGASGNAGEFGHIIIDRKGPECHCGNRGCWETLASEDYVVKKTLASDSFGEELTKTDVYKLAEEGNEEIISIFKSEGRNLGIGISNIINSLSPQLVVVGGGIVQVKDYIYDELMKVVAEETLDVSYRKTRVKFSQLGDSATVYGLASLIFNKKLIFCE